MCSSDLFFTAISTIEKPREHTYDAGTVWSAAVLTEVLDKGKGFPINDGGVGVRKYFPILLRPVQLLFLLERLAAGTEIDSIAYILLPVQNARHCAGTPVTGMCRRFGWTIDTHALKILAGGHHALRAQFLGDLSRPQAADRQLEDLPHYLRR